MKAPDPGWLPFAKMLFGFSTLIVLAVLAAMIAMGDVRQESSHGLTYILGGLTVLSGQFAQWAFGEIVKKKDGE